VGRVWAAQPVCNTCFAERNPGRTPVRLRDPNVERCCYCGAITEAGIYVRERLDAVPFPTPEEG
jgi:hypothetical protein